MTVPQNQAAWLKEANTPLEVGDAPVPVAGPDEIVVKNAAVAINPLDCHMQDVGVFVKEFPAVFGCDVAGEVYEVGANVTRFQKGDRVIGHCINLVTGRPSDGAYSLYTVVPESKAAHLPEQISFTRGVVVPFALEAAVCALSVQTPGPCMPGVTTPALGLPYPSLQVPPPPQQKTLIVYGASSSVGSMTTQLAAATGLTVIAICGTHNFSLAKQCGANYVFDHKSDSLVEDVLVAIKSIGHPVAGIFDAISTPDTYKRNLAILNAQGGGHLACVHPPPTEEVPDGVKTGMIFAVNDVANPVYRDFVAPALGSGLLKCLPEPLIVGKGLNYINKALKKCKEGVSATKLVVEL